MQMEQNGKFLFLKDYHMAREVIETKLYYMDVDMCVKICKFSDLVCYDVCWRRSL